ncbi:MAG: M48 family metallopeptidase [Solirubrobacteraceae bacterium]
MTETLPESIEPFINISSKAYEHPADRAATAALKAIPMLDTVVRKLIEWRYERALRQSYLATSVKVSERQLPELWTAHTAACRTLDMPEIYDLYVTSPVPGLALAIGSEKPMIVIDSMLLMRLGPGEQRVVVAHELGHILSDHVVYMTALNILLGVGSGLPFFLGIPFRAVRAVLLEWYRAAELSCDRAATLAVRDPRIVCRTLMVTAGAMPASDLNLDAFMTQAMEYENWDDPSDRVRRFFNEIGRTHSYAVTRVSEVMRWVQSGEYDRIVRGEYRTRDQEADVRAEAGDAMEFYAERFRTILREAGDNITNLGSQMGNMAEQAADWLRNRRGTGNSKDSSSEGSSKRTGSSKQSGGSPGADTERGSGSEGGSGPDDSSGLFTDPDDG